MGQTPVADKTMDTITVRMETWVAAGVPGRAQAPMVPGTATAVITIIPEPGMEATAGTEAVIAAREVRIIILPVHRITAT